MRYLLFILLFWANFVHADTFYVSTTGNDANPGTINSSFLTIGKLNSVLTAGDIAYIRGGTYLSPTANSDEYNFQIQNLTGTALNPIVIQAYPGEVPIFSGSNKNPTHPTPRLFVIYNSDYVIIKGLKFTFLRQSSAANPDVANGFGVWDCNYVTVENCEVSHIAGRGFYLANSFHCLIKNVDAHHMGDYRDTGYGAWNTGDGFDVGSGGDGSSDNTFDGCRAWLCCDDGWECFDWDGDKVTIKNCWSFWNGVKPWKNNNFIDVADMTPEVSASAALNSPYLVGGFGGEGFKLGGHNPGVPNRPDPTALRKYIQNCLAFENTGVGFPQNMEAQYAHKMSMVNCVAYKNLNDGFGFGVGRSSDPDIAHVFKNNIAFGNNIGVSGGDFVYDGLATNVSNNYWGTYYGNNYGNLNSAYGGNVTVSATDFLSLSTVGVAGPRQSDGSLPNIQFLKPVGSSDIIDKGVNVGLPYFGNSPDLGAFEYTNIVLPIKAGFLLTNVNNTQFQWQSYDEQDIAYWKIEESTDLGKSWHSFKNVAAKFIPSFYLIKL